MCCVYRTGKESYNVVAVVNSQAADPCTQDVAPDLVAEGGRVDSEYISV